MNGFLLDTNVLLDIATADATWLAWSEGQFRAAAAQGPILINPIVYAELAPAFATQSDLDRWLDPAVFQRLPLPYDAGWLAAQAFLKYRRAGGTKNSPLPDFYIGGASRSRGADAGDPRHGSLPHILSTRRAHRSLSGKKWVELAGGRIRKREMGVRTFLRLLQTESIVRLRN